MKKLIQIGAWYNLGVLALMLLRIALHYPSNHGKSAFEYLDTILVGIPLGIPLLFQRGWRRLLFLLPFANLLFMVVCDRFNILVDYEIWGMRGLPEIGTLQDGINNSRNKPCPTDRYLDKWFWEYDSTRGREAVRLDGQPTQSGGIADRTACGDHRGETYPRRSFFYSSYAVRKGSRLADVIEQIRGGVRGRLPNGKVQGFDFTLNFKSGDEDGGPVVPEFSVKDVLLEELLTRVCGSVGYEYAIHRDRIYIYPAGHKPVLSNRVTPSSVEDSGDE